MGRVGVGGGVRVWEEGVGVGGRRGRGGGGGGGVGEEGGRGGEEGVGGGEGGKVRVGKRGELVEEAAVPQRGRGYKH